jgi:outer membrane receptor protein involved in Fe transport
MASFRRLHHCLWVLVALSWTIPLSATSLDGLLLTEAIDRLESAGLPVIYSSDLVKPWLRVRSEPESNDPASILAEILAPHGLGIRREDGVILVVRSAPVSAPPIAEAPARKSAGPAPLPPLNEVVVSASRYALVQGPSPSFNTLDAADLRLLPNAGNDPLRALTRLPGTVSSDLSARSNIRGGEYNETLVRFDGLRLFDPFHLRDFQALFSAINPALVERIDVFTGGYPVRYGDRMSSVIDVATRDGRDAQQREVSLSFFNASLLLTDSFNGDDSDWLVSARRGNLDLILDALRTNRGKPRYFDVYGRLGHRFSDSLRVSGNLLLIEDQLRVQDNDLEEIADADYRDAYAWLNFEHQIGANLAGRTLLAYAHLESLRKGSADQPGISSGDLVDDRRFDLVTLQSDWSWTPDEMLELAAGLELRRERGRYDYRDGARFDLLFLTPGAATLPTRSTRVANDPSGNYFGAYSNLRLDLLPRVTTELGLRWDTSSLIADGGGYLSPRAALLFQAAPDTRLRISWGRFHQTQNITELQVNDGVTEFQRAQRADHLILGIEQALGRTIGLRAEIYRKTYSNLRPRYESLLGNLRLLPELKPDRVRIAPERAEARGLELSLQGRDGEPWSWWLSYSLSEVLDVENGREILRQWDQQHTVLGGIAWTTAQWEFSAAGTWHSGWPTSRILLVATDPVALVAVGPRNEQRLDSYASVDLRVARNWAYGDDKEIVVFLDVRNVFNRRNPCCVEYELDPEAQEPTLLVEPVDYFGIVPSLGFIWRF